MTITENLSTNLAQPHKAPSHWLQRRAKASLKIEHAALKLFLMQGPEHTSIEDIAEAAGISRRTLFRYFRSRDEILAAMPTRHMLSASRMVCERPASESICEALLSVTRTKMLDESEQEIMALSQQVMMRFPECWSSAVGELRSAMDASYQAMISHRLHLAGYDTAGAEVIAAGLAAIVVSTYGQWVKGNCQGQFADHLQQSLCHFTAIGLPNPAAL